MPYLPRLLELLKRKDYIPLPVERLAEQLRIPAGELNAFKDEVAVHLRQGTLVKLKKNRLCLPRDADLVAGMIRFRQSGSAQVFRDPGESGEVAPPLQIRAEDTHVAMHGDRVVARINQDRRRWQKARKGQPTDPAQETGRVIRILERARETLTGTLQKSRMFHYVIPDDPRIIQDILVPAPETSGVQPVPQVNDKVIVKLLPWEQRHLNPEGEIVGLLGKTHTPLSEYKALLHQYDLDPNFPEEVLREVRKLPEKVTKRDLKDRTDLRSHYVFTIDPQDAKDFDDALHVEKLDNGNLRIGVHIADVSAYVRPGTALDTEARHRGNSTYLVGTVIPMLPHELSSGLCSLVEDEDRLTKSVFLEFTPRGRLVNTSFANTVIRSRKRLSYEQAYAILFEDRLEVIRALPTPPKHQTGASGRALAELDDQEIREIQGHLRTLWSIAKGMREKRLKSGALDLDMPETKIYVDEQGWADRIVKVSNDESHQLIEEFMLAANEAIAETLNKRRIPLIHRVHDKPDPEKLQEFREFLSTFGIEAGDMTNRREANKVLLQIKDHPQGHLLRTQFLRSLAAAEYRASADGHYGLNKTHYAHFTSPIRRYSDLIVHRIFNLYLANQGQPGAEEAGAKYDLGALAAIAQHLSITERNSTDAERESVKIKLLEFFERELERPQKRTFEALVVDIRNHGMFVELTESMAYGLVHISTLTDDLYMVSKDHAQLIGRKGRRKFRLGQKIRVVVHRVDRFKRQIDFAVAPQGPNEEAAEASSAPAAAPSQPSAKKARPQENRNRRSRQERPTPERPKPQKKSGARRPRRSRS